MTLQFDLGTYHGWAQAAGKLTTTYMLFTGRGRIPWGGVVQLAALAANGVYVVPAHRPPGKEAAMPPSLSLSLVAEPGQ